MRRIKNFDSFVNEDLNEFFGLFKKKKPKVTMYNNGNITQPSRAPKQIWLTSEQQSKAEACKGNFWKLIEEDLKGGFSLPQWIKDETAQKVFCLKMIVCQPLVYISSLSVDPTEWSKCDKGDQPTSQVIYANVGPGSGKNAGVKTVYEEAFMSIFTYVTTQYPEKAGDPSKWDEDVWGDIRRVYDWNPNQEFVEKFKPNQKSFKEILSEVMPSLIRKYQK